MLLTRIEELVFVGGRASYRRVEITSIIRSCLLRSPDIPVHVIRYIVARRNSADRP